MMVTPEFHQTEYYYAVQHNLPYQRKVQLDSFRFNDHNRVLTEKVPSYTVFV